jgi:hypothetical protein
LQTFWLAPKVYPKSEPRSLSIIHVTLLFGVLRIFGITSGSYEAVILLTLSALIFWWLSEKEKLLDLLDKESAEVHNSLSAVISDVTDIKKSLPTPNGVYGIYLSRDKLPPYKEFIENTREQIVIISIDLEDTSSRYLDILFELAKRNCHIHLLALKPDSHGLMSVANLLGQRDDRVKSRIENNLAHIMERRAQRLSGEQLNNFQVKVYDWAPTWVGMAVDPGTQKGKLLVGVCQHGPAKGNWPEFELRPESGDDALYRFYSLRFTQAWDDAQVYQQTV